ncbi:MAG: FeoB small GTPase domain-containing protein [Candidatus Helarchaeota archaeon]
MNEITIALIGNPNVGKTVIFNNLTGAKQHVANWPGVTVEKKTGSYTHRGVKISVVDLPGTYSLTSNSIDEKIARNFIIEEKPDVVVDIVDGTVLERNLYLTLLLIELGANVLVALNMFDAVQQSGIQIDVKKLEELLGIPVIPTIATKNIGMNELKDKILELAKNRVHIKKELIGFSPKIEVIIVKIMKILKEVAELSKTYSPRWIAVKILEEDQEVLEKIPSDIMEKINEVIENASRN